MNCEICPRSCKVDRTNKNGFCRMNEMPVAAKAFLHNFEEPLISGWNGSGTIFFSGCNLRCSYCQNYPISHDCHGVEISIERLAEIYFELYEKGAHNINLVNPTHFTDSIIKSIESVKDRISIPFIWNSSGYEKPVTLRKLEGLIDVFLPDIKYYSRKLSILYSGAEDYFEYASCAVLEMYRQVGGVVVNNHGLIQKGLIIRHLVLPNSVHDSVKILEWIRDNVPRDAFISIMGQYTPMHDSNKIKGLNRRLSKREYGYVLEKLNEYGFDNGYIQSLDSASSQYTPEFDFEGL